MSNKERRILSVVDFRGGLNTRDHPTKILDNQLAAATNVLLEAGEVKKRQGRSNRYASTFGSNPVCGLHPFYKSDRTTHLLINEGTRILKDTPHLVTRYTSQDDWSSGTGVNIDITSSVGDVKIDTDLPQDISVTNTGSAPKIYGDKWHAQSFDVTRNSFLKSIELLGDIAANYPPPNDLICEIQGTDGSGYPNGATLATASVAPADFSPYEWHKIEFTSLVFLPAGQYAIVLHTTGGDVDYSYRLRSGTSDVYSSGYYFVSTDAGTTWPTRSARDISFKVHFAATWLSPWIDISSAVDGNSGNVAVDAALPPGATVTVQTRTNSTNSATGAEAWRDISPDGVINSTYNNWIQILLILGMAATTPTVSEVVLSYDGTPEAAELATGLTANTQWFWDTWHDLAIGTNGADAVKKFDGTTLADLGGSPPAAQFIAHHGDYLFLAGNPTYRSRLYWCDLGNPEGWTATNWVDIDEDDGDEITQITSFSPGYLVIFKKFSIHVLLGRTESEFRREKVVEGIGCVAPRSVQMVLGGLAFLSRDGVRMFRGDANPIWLSELVQPTLDACNIRKFNLAASLVVKHLYLLFVANSDSIYNNVCFVFDTRWRQDGQYGAWVLFTNWPVSVACLFRQYNEDTPIGGGANEAQLYHLFDGYNDAGTAIAATIETKHFDFGRRDILKKLRDIKVYSKTTALADEITVASKGQEEMAINYARFLGLEITHSTLDVGYSFFGADFTYEEGADR